MRKYLTCFFIFFLCIILSADHIRTLNIVQTPAQPQQTETEIVSPFSAATTTPSPIDDTDNAVIQPETTPTPELFPDLYGCAMEISFSTGPLAGNKTEFTVLGREYFGNKGDSFYPGKNTAVYYDPPHYLILHSAFYNGNMLKPLEAEFIRFYLEYWGTSGDAYIQGNIDSLIGSTVIWKCDDDVIFLSTIREIVRLSQVASDQLWLDPWNLEQILIEQEGLVSEWVGEMKVSDEPTIYLGFCGWGPEDSGDNRFAYYRYLINFDLDTRP